MDELNKQIDLMLEHSLEEAVFLDERNKGKIENWSGLTRVWRTLTDIIQDYTTEDDMLDFASFMQKGKMPIATGFKRISGNTREPAKVLSTLNPALSRSPQKNTIGEISPEEEEETSTTTPTPPTTTPVTPPATPTPPRPELTPAERAARKAEATEIANEAALILAIAAFESSSPTSMVPKMARILKKYFISYRVPKQRSIAEELESLSEETTPAPTTSSSTPTPPTTSSASADRATDALLRDLFDEEDVDPDISRETLEKLERRYNDIIADYKNAARSSDAEAKSKVARIKGFKNLILQAADRGMMQEGKGKQLIIDLNKVKENHLDEGMLRMFGAWIEYFLNGLFGGWMPPVSVRGSQKDVEAFAHALAGEKKYIETAKRYGLNHPTTYKNKAKLGNAVKGFEKETGIKWPFK